VSVLPITEQPDEPVDERALLPPIEFPTRLDEALRDGRAARPDTVHIRRKEAA